MEDRQDNQEREIEGSGHGRLVLRPGVEIVLWLKDWIIVAFCAAILWQFIETGTLLIQAAPLSTAWLMLWNLLVILSAFPVIFCVELWVGMHRRAVRNYDIRLMVRIIDAVLGLILCLCLLFIFWILSRLRGLFPTEMASASLPVKQSSEPGLVLSVILWALVAFAVFHLARMISITASRFSCTIGSHGLGGACRRVLAMALVGLR
jgi:hypothetical protein